MNVKYTRLHKSRPYSIVFNRQPNGLADYSKIDPTPSSEMADEKIINERYRFVQDVLVPAISKRILETQSTDHAKFAKKHKIIDTPYPIGSQVMIKNAHRQNKLDERYEGPYLIHKVTDNGAYTLMDKTGALLSRDVPTHHIVYKAAANLTPTTSDEFTENHYEIQAVVDHKSLSGSYLYRVQWKGFPDPEEDTWEPVESFDSTKHIELYWGRRDGAQAIGKRRVAPKTVNLRAAATRKERKRGGSQKKRS
jgi:hypothetical protein